MVQLILLQGGQAYHRQVRQDAPALLEHDGACYSLRAGPRTPLPTDRIWEPVAVYAMEDFSEEEFQDLYAGLRGQVPEFGLRY